MTTVAPEFDFGTGAESAAEAQEEIGGGVGFRRAYLPQIGEGNFLYLRYISDHHQWIHATCHPSFPTKPAPSDWPKDRNWPKQVSPTCRRDKAFKGFYGDCYCEDSKILDQWKNPFKPKLRVWAVAVLREEVVATQAHVDAGVIVNGAPVTPEMIGRRIGFTDKVREVLVPDLDANGNEQVDDKGKTKYKVIEEIALVIVNKAMINYFAALKSVVPLYGNTLCANDFAVVETGTGAKVEWGHQSVNDTRGVHQPGTESWARYEQARIDQGLTDADLKRMLAERASDEFFAKYIDPSKPQPTYAAMTGKAPGQTAQAAAPAQGVAQQAPQGAQQQAVAQAASNDVDADALARMRARLQPGGAAPAPADQPTATPTPAAAGTSDAPQQDSQPAAQPTQALSEPPAGLVLPN